jgi:hypothetical protein
MNKTDMFITQCKLFLDNNDAIYDNDKKKISYILSLMEGGTAGDWAQMKATQFMAPVAAGATAGTTNWSTYDDFLRIDRSLYSSR